MISVVNMFYCIVDLIEFSPASGSDNMTGCIMAASNSCAEPVLSLDDEVRLLALLCVCITVSFCMFSEQL